MKLREEFTIQERLEDVWKFLQQAEMVAACMPGMESVDVIDDDNVQVRVSQRVGPMSATFDAKVRVLDRVDGQSIRFEAVGKSVRGAAGSLRALNTVTLQGAGDGTLVIVEGDVALAGALGSVGQKVVAKQASKVTQQFVANLRSGMTGEPPDPGAAAVARGVTTGRPGERPVGQLAPSRAGDSGPEGLSSWLKWWLVANTAVSVASLAFWVVALRRVMRRLDGVPR